MEFTALFGADEGSKEGTMDQDLFWMRTETGASETSPAPAHRRSRPLTRLQEFAVLAVAFGFGAVLQVAYLLHAGPLAP